MCSMHYMVHGGHVTLHSIHAETYEITGAIGARLSPGGCSRYTFLNIFTIQIELLNYIQ